MTAASSISTSTNQNSTHHVEGIFPQAEQDLIIPRVKEIAMQARLGEFKAAEKSFKALSEVVTKFTVSNDNKPKLDKLLNDLEQEIFRPVYKFIHNDRELFLYYKSLRILKLVDDEFATKVLRAWHRVNHIIDLFRGDGLLDARYLSIENMRLRPQVNMGKDNPIFFVNFSKNFDITYSTTASGEVTFIVQELSGNKASHVMKRSAETELMIFYTDVVNSLSLLEVTKNQKKSDSGFYGWSLALFFSGGDKYHWSRSVLTSKKNENEQIETSFQNIGHDNHLNTFMRDSFNVNLGEDFESGVIKDIFDAMNSINFNLSLYSHPLGTILISGASIEDYYKREETPDFCLPGTVMRHKERYSHSPFHSFIMATTEYCCNVAWISENGIPSFVTYVGNGVSQNFFDAQQRSDLNNLQFQVGYDNKQTKVFVCTDTMKRENYSTKHEYLEALNSSAISMTFNRTGWHNVAITIMNLQFSRDDFVEKYHCYDTFSLYAIFPETSDQRWYLEYSLNNKQNGITKRYSLIGENGVWHQSKRTIERLVSQRLKTEGTVEVPVNADGSQLGTIISVDHASNPEMMQLAGVKKESSFLIVRKLSLWDAMQIKILNEVLESVLPRDVITLIRGYCQPIINQKKQKKALTATANAK